MTQAVKQLIEAIRDLENSSYQYSAVKREVGMLCNEWEETNLYVAIGGDAWQKYLKAGGSRSMDNMQVPEHLRFNFNHRAELDT